MTNGEPGIPSDRESTCPVERISSDCVLLAHGEGGRLMRHLLKTRILPILAVEATEDSGRICVESGEMALSTDSYVVSPLIFPGGDIGSLAVYGTANDLAVAGADPICLTVSLIIEEGLSFDVLDRVLLSISNAAIECGVQIVSGDTKVVPRGAADKLFINTTGVGRYRSASRLSCGSIKVGDLLVASGPIGRHGIAVLSARERLRMIPEPRSDSAALQVACAALHNALGTQLRAMRDATRGGVSAVMHEWAEASQSTMRLEEVRIPVASNTRGICELLGLDPLYVANEGIFLSAIAPDAIDRALEVLHAIPVSASAQLIGRVIARQSSPVVIERMLGVLHPVDEPSGAPLPRIC